MKPPSLLVLAAACGVLVAADWPQFRGPERDDISKETGLLKTWPAGGPKLLWTNDQAGLGYSGPAVVGERLYTMGARDKTEYVYALDTRNGKEIWVAPVGETFTFKGNNWGDGPRATPTVDGELLYALGGQGELVCVETATGKERWRKSMTKDLKGGVSLLGGASWGYSWSPLVDGDQVICVPGGSQGTLAALNKKTGEVIWRSQGLTDPAPYASPLARGSGNDRQYIQLVDHGVAGVAAKDGRVLWDYHRKPHYNDVVIPTPVIQDNEVYTATVDGCDLVKVSEAAKGLEAVKVYGTNKMKNVLGGFVLLDGKVYGYFEGKGWTCQDFKTGQITWSSKALGKGSLTCADGRLYCYTEDDGIVALAEPNAKAWKPAGRFEIPRKSKFHPPDGEQFPGGKVWTHPVVANGRLYLRDQELIFCYDVKK
jgi:outer membrane protein assembly factor BamB